MERWERGGGESLVKGGGKEGKAAAGGGAGAEGDQPLRRRVASAKPNKQSGAKDRARNPNAAKTSRAAKEAATKGPAEEGALQTNPKLSGGGGGKPPAVAPRPRKRVKQAAASATSRGQSAAEGEEGAPNTGLRRSKRIANRK